MDSTTNRKREKEEEETTTSQNKKTPLESDSTEIVYSRQRNTWDLSSDGGTSRQYGTAAGRS